MTFHFLYVLDLESMAEKRLLGSKRVRAIEVARVLSLGGKRVCVERCWDGLYGLSFESSGGHIRAGIADKDVVERLIESQRVRRVHRVMVRCLSRRRR